MGVIEVMVMGHELLNQLSTELTLAILQLSSLFLWRRVRRRTKK